MTIAMGKKRDKACASRTSCVRVAVSIRCCLTPSSSPLLSPLLPSSPLLSSNLCQCVTILMSHVVSVLMCLFVSISLAVSVWCLGVGR